MNTWPSKARPSARRTVLRAPSQASSQSQLRRVGAGRGLDRDARAVARGVDAGDPVAEAQLDPDLQRALDQELLEIVLLAVDEGRHAMAGLGQQVELVDHPVAPEHLALLPGDALVEHPLADAEAVEDLERALGVADRARAGAGRGARPRARSGRDAAQRADRARATGRPARRRPRSPGGATARPACLVGAGAEGVVRRHGAAPGGVSPAARATSRGRAAWSRSWGRPGRAPRHRRARRRTACNARRSPSGRSAA